MNISNIGGILSLCPAEFKRDFIRDLGFASESVGRRLSTGRSSAGDTHWKQWTNFAAELGCDPFFETIENKIPLLQVFLHQVRTGRSATNKNPVKSRSAEEHLRSIWQTFSAVGKRDPHMNANNKIDIRIQRMLRSYAKEDPPPNRVKPVPISVLRHIFAISACTLCAHSACAFFFLLRPGEYTHSSQDSVPFELKDVQLFQGTPCLDLNTATDAQLLAASFASLTFDTQKNAVRGEVIGQGHSGDPHLSPTKILARRVIHLRSHGAPPNAPRHTMTLKEICSTSSRPISLQPCKMLFDS